MRYNFMRTMASMAALFTISSPLLSVLDFDMPVLPLRAGRAPIGRKSHHQKRRIMLVARNRRRAR